MAIASALFYFNYHFHFLLSTVHLFINHEETGKVEDVLPSSRIKRGMFMEGVTYSDVVGTELRLHHQNIRF